ncbi:hypothetical protein [Pseudodesulfovibrio sp.]|uniref:hypothetical protein n=1 Tax=Pseudodesulfovibrio sp. TaxID=2035812 RepID=UPI00261B627D|nr:hypothetical protein [Pseudodesulfovibrio sp.]MDD3311171.1 hypothetical protein [Pseudodesulfovibrio sp.]
MANDFNQDEDRSLLAELLRDVDDPKEAEALRRAWEATARLRDESPPAPPLSRELEAALKRVDEALSDDDLDMLAAAGTYPPGHDDTDLF